MKLKKRLLIVGGVAGGASCAARARRMDDDREIIVFERGPHVSFANCGLPYYVGKVIKKQSDLFLATPRLFKERFNISVRTRSEVQDVDTRKQTIRVRDLDAGQDYEEAYDDLVLAPGAAFALPHIPGIGSEGVFSVRTVPDANQIKQWIDRRKAKTALVAGGGFIGLEMAENLAALGLSVSLVERASHCMPPLDPEMAVVLHQGLEKGGVRLFLNTAITGFEATPQGLLVRTQAGQALETDLVILAMGVKPEIELAQKAGIEIGGLGGIRVNPLMQTSAPHVYAVGDVVETVSPTTGQPALIPLAGPANRQGRVAADNITRPQTPRKFDGILGTWVCGLMGMVAAGCGETEERLVAQGRESWAKIYTTTANHAGYYPGSKTLLIKLLYEKGSGRIWGAQAVGEKGVEKRIDVIATVMKMGGTLYDLEEMELCYAPQFGSAKDPVNLTGMIAANVLRGDCPTVYWEDAADKVDFLLDVRTRGEVRKGAVPGAVNIPLDELRGRLDELPRDQIIGSYCYVGQRSYVAVRMMLQNGLAAKNLAGGYHVFGLMEKSGK